MQKVTFSCGKTENVYVVPVLALADLDDLPEYKVADDDTAEDVKGKLEAVAQAKADTGYLAGFADTVVPDDWQFPGWALSQGLKPREGADGRKLDYIRYELLRQADDVRKAQRAMLGQLTPEEVGSAVKKFRPLRAARRLFSARRRR